MENNNRNSINKINRIRHWHRVSAYLVLYDILAVTAAYFLALLLRFDFQFSRIPVVYLLPWLYFAPVYAAICVLVFWRLRLYNSIWRFASFTELQRITAATAVTTVIHIIGVTAILRILVSQSEYSVGRMPISYYIIGPILQAILVTAIRFSYRFILLLRAQRAKPASSNIMIIGMHSIIGTT